MGRSQAIWGPTASTFDPGRWITPYQGRDGDVSASSLPTEDLIRSPRGTLNEHGGAAKGHQYGMLTFLKGPKGCTGERFVKAEMRRVVAVLVAGFQWTPAQTHEPEQVGILVIKPAGRIAV
ncbi:uncharacterized protein LY79DRAFT_659463 [Colletotrichum navitas]|uniref:Uncharacterized protein n=1 Tax=Colletotrichum navitas TaxID=681940 RepID=A0AAD8PZD5_9PEZI|nr:uncharacterized protein LY79DRAFT_659463 [Colletotrichum navitas]KAK1590393.1 hypothetical protein LY79DRAFT_659463 [Colletotrichum navitas]